METTKKLNQPLANYISIVVLGVAIVLGIAMRFLQYLAATSYFKDELYSLYNIHRLSFAGLFTEDLEYNQIANFGFHWGQKLIISLVGFSNEYTARFFPFIFSILSIYMVYLIGKRFFKGWILYLSIIPTAISFWAIINSSNAKPYMGDVFFIMCMVYAMLVIVEKDIMTKWKTVVLGIIGFFTAIYSLPGSVFVLICLLMLWWKPGKEKIKELAPIWGLWLLGGIISAIYLLFFLSSSDQDAMQGYWDFAFQPSNGIIDILSYILNALYAIPFNYLVYGVQNPISNALLYLCLVLAVFGIVSLWKSNRFQMVLLLAPILMSILFTLFKVLPMSTVRLSIYFSWTIFLLAFVGLHFLTTQVNSKLKTVFASVMTILMLGQLLVAYQGAKTLPLQVEPTKKGLMAIKENLKEGDIVIIPQRGTEQMAYYTNEIDIGEYVIGTADFSSEDQLINDLKPYKENNRVWYFFLGYRPEANPGMQEYRFKEILDEHGKKLEEFTFTSFYPTWVRLYDFTSEIAVNNDKSLGILGSAISGWDSSTPLQQINDERVWETEIELSEGEIKFRLNDSWDTNWGGMDFPKGELIPGGPNIPVKQGNYKLKVNLESNTYEFIAF
ncbi:glycosyltransferase family 39 protein [Flagellimonas zhangzhouensis]|uniref:Dolichyl-phosphate-mannose-protein mannosyltransferase n=1 Tax=Flagellimonas zhangzhouensis TaxID=1073328 RepID=A0A1H2QKS8_9FLAO|nr:glycosyltransferase family 39 protein [Allomuricauda zhangzhouensis]SDQ54377.1 Dolichyl-phosphate-mannose-protein mannosyltransferase [Allomuricauda zhangzhouensis]SDW07751.1 Dolichyl-phosphate-mannose-protein mannosyltransferase [Allomuricauda zhangzhouensis]